jgi:hypothetical protein
MCIFAQKLVTMNNCTLTSTIDDNDAYAVEMDAAYITNDVDVVDNLQYQLEQIANDDCDIQFE